MTLDLSTLERRFGLLERRHRIGELDLRFVEPARPDDLVRQLYPEVLAGESQGAGDAPTWPVCWPAAYGLAEHVVHALRPAGRSVLELGCGTAVPAVAAERAGADVLATDRDPLALVFARENARRNACRRIRFASLDWFAPPPLPPFDVVLGADVVYLPDTFAALLDLAAAALAPRGRFLLSDPDRPQMTDFLALARSRGWTVADAPWSTHLADSSHTGRIRILAPPGTPSRG
ncbi:MAG: methyltransferase domain-containing protein [Deltaproteobacteria bacterium]|nr:methyltransferase domain-containing protein [Deltaproteobacteria bacterium]